MHEATEIFYLCLAWCLFWGGMRSRVSRLPDGTFVVATDDGFITSAIFWAATCIFVLNVIHIIFEEESLYWIRQLRDRQASWPEFSLQKPIHDVMIDECFEVASPQAFRIPCNRHIV